MASKFSFVIAMLFLAMMVAFLACVGWVQGYPWWHRNRKS